jgi:hypothetical protein
VERLDIRQLGQEVRHAREAPDAARLGEVRVAHRRERAHPLVKALDPLGFVHHRATERVDRHARSGRALAGVVEVTTAAGPEALHHATTVDEGAGAKFVILQHQRIPSITCVCVQ